MYDSFACVSHSVSLRMRPLRDLSSPHTPTRGLILQQARCHGLRRSNRCVGIWFQGLLTPVLPVLFIVRSRYLFVIGRWLVFSLGGWSPRIHTRFPVSGVTWDTARFKFGSLRGCHPLWLPFQAIHETLLPHIAVPQPRHHLHDTGLGCFHFARHYSGNIG